MDSFDDMAQCLIAAPEYYSKTNLPIVCFSIKKDRFYKMSCFS